MGLCFKCAATFVPYQGGEGMGGAQDSGEASWLYSDAQEGGLVDLPTSVQEGMSLACK